MAGSAHPTTLTVLILINGRGYKDRGLSAGYECEIYNGRGTSR